MTNATLGLRIESEEAEVAEKRLDGFSASAAKAERATDSLASGSSRADGAIAKMVASIEAGVRDLVAMGQANLILAQHANQAATATAGLAAANDHLGREAGGSGAAVRQLDAHVDAFRASAAAAAAEARALAAAEKEAAAAAADLASRSAALKASVDPVGTAIDKVAADLREAEVLYRSGAISQEQYGNASQVLRARLAGVTAAHVQGVTSSKHMTQATLNLSRQFADVGVTAAMGMNPLMIMIQQGPQIADAFQMAASQGLGFSAVLKGMGVQLGLVRVQTSAAMTAQIAQTAAALAQAQAGVAAAAAQTAAAVTAAEVAAANTAATAAASALAVANTAVAETATAAAAAETLALGPLLAILAPILAVVAAVTAGFALFHRELSKGYPKNITDGLNLTEEQLKKVKGTTVTFGDTLQATFNVAGKAIMDGPVGKALKWLAGAFGAALDWIVKAAIDGTANIIGFFMTAVDMIGKYWKQLPALIAVAVEAAVNLVIDGVNRLIQGAAGGLNRIIKATNDVTGSKFAEVSVQGFDHIKLASGAAVDAIREDWTATMKDNVASVRASMTSIADAIGAEALRLAQADALKEAGDAAKEAAKSGDQRAQSLLRELEAMKATTDANYELARAYETSGAAAAEAEAKAEAVGKAIRRQGDIALFVAATLALNASKAAVEGAKAIRDLTDNTDAQRRLNAQVAAGLLTSDQANEALALEAKLRPLIAAAATQEGDEKAYLEGLVVRLTEAQKKANDEAVRAQLIADNAKARDQIALIQKETELLGASNMVRAVTLAQLAKEQELRSKGVDSGSTEWADAIKGAGDLAAAQVTATQAADNHNAALYEQLDLLQGIEDRARDAGQGMADAFGPVGKALGDLTSMVAGYAAAQEEAARRTADAIQAAGDDQIAVDRITRESAEASARARIDQYGDLLSASKGFFAKESVAYQTLQAAEKAYRAFQFAMSLKAMFFKTAETTATVTGAAIETAAVVGAEGVKTTATLAGTAARIPAKIAEGAASMFAALGPMGFVAVGAMLAVLAAIGFSGAGGGGSGSIPTMPTTNNGTGTVLGDGNDPSESLKKSLEMSERYWNKDLDYSNKMVTALRAIQSNIGNLTTAIAREMNIGGGLDPSGLNKGPTTSGGLFGIGATTRSSSVVGSGINLNGGSLNSLIANGVTGALYQIVQNTKTKSGFLGIGGGTTTWNTETKTGIDGQLSKEVSRVLASLRDGVLTAAGQLGVTGAEAALNAFQVNLGRISFDGLSSAEINQKLNDVFSAVGDQMVQAILPGLSAFQKAGEGLFETLARLVTEYKAVDDVMAMLGKTFGPVGLESVKARTRLIELAGGLEAFTESAAFFTENFLTEAQRMAPIQAAVSAELARLGVASNISREQFAALVMGLDVSTESGAAMYAALMALAPALSTVIDYSEKAADAVEAAQKAQLKLVEDARSALSQAYKREAGTIQGVIDKFGSFGKSLRAFRDTLGQADESTATYASRRADFLRTANLARLGNEEALGSLQGVSQDFLASSLENASSNLAYQRDLAAVRAAVDAAIATADRGKTNAERQLEALDASVAGLIEVNESVLTVRDAIRDLMLVMSGQAPLGPTPATSPTAAYAPDFSPVPLSTTGATPIGLADPADLVAEVRGLRQEVASLRAEQTAGNTAIAQNTGRTARTLDGWDADGLPPERDAA